MKKKLGSKTIAQAGILVAIVAIMSITPLGFIPLGPMNATINHIPVIIGSLIGGPIVGALTGLGFGLISWFNSFVRPNITSFAFWNPLVSIFPRIIIGIVPYYIHKLIKGLNQANKKALSFGLGLLGSGYFIFQFYDFFKQGQYWYVLVWLVVYVLFILTLYLNITNPAYSLEVSLAAASGAMVNTGLVMGLIYVLYAERFASTLGFSKELATKAILNIALINGIPETIVSVIIVSATMSRIKKR